MYRLLHALSGRVRDRRAARRGRVRDGGDCEDARFLREAAECGGRGVRLALEAFEGVEDAEGRLACEAEGDVVADAVICLRLEGGNGGGGVHGEEDALEALGVFLLW